MPEKTWVETMTRPNGLLKVLFKTPILLYRLGMGVWVGRLFMLMTTTGQISLAQARKTTRALEDAIEKLEKNVNARLLTEVTLMDWPRL